LTFWATRPRVRALWTLIMAALGLTCVGVSPDVHVQLSVSAVFVLVWAAGWRSVRALMRLVVACSPAFWRAIWLVRGYLAGLAFVLVSTSRSKVTIDQGGWLSKSEDDLLVCEARGGAWVRRTFDSIQSVGSVLAFFLTPIIWVHNQLPSALTTKSAIPVANYTLD